jgi:subtilisin-like proprotein convertase family protein
LILLGAGCATGTSVPDAAGSADATGGNPDASAGPPDARVIDAAPPFDGESAGPGFFLDNEAADFEGLENTFEYSTIEQWGAVAPAGYYTGGLRVRAADADTFTNPASTQWSDILGFAYTGIETVARTLNASWSAAPPQGAGLSDREYLTLTLEGEIYLDDGSWTFYLLADDHAFFEIAEPGTTSFTRLISASLPSEESGAYVALAAGWHPIRIAVSNLQTGSSLRLQALEPGNVVQTNISRHRLRFRADGIDGLYMAAFDDSHLLGLHEVTIDDTDPSFQDWADGAPAGLGLSNADTFSLRWAGQLRIELDGDYAFRYISDDGQRVWLDGGLILDDWDETSHDNLTAPIALVPGWHDLVIDYSETSGAARARFSVETGPDLVGGALPVERLRPVVTRRERYETGVDSTNYAIPDNGMVEASVVLDTPLGAKAAGIDVSWTFDHSYHTDLEIRLIAPDGSSALLRDDESGSGTVTQRLFIHDLDDATANGLWRLRVEDTVSLDTGTLEDFEVTVHHRTGASPIPTSAAFESGVKDLGSMVTRLDSLSWGARVPAGAAVQLRVRSGDTEDGLLAAAWSTPLLDGSGGPPSVQPHRFFQYRIEFTSDGDSAPIVDWVRLDYSTEL